MVVFLRTKSWRNTVLEGRSGEWLWCPLIFVQKFVCQPHQRQLKFIAQWHMDIPAGGLSLCLQVKLVNGKLDITSLGTLPSPSRGNFICYPPTVLRVTGWWGGRARENEGREKGGGEPVRRRQKLHLLSVVAVLTFHTPSEDLRSFLSPLTPWRKFYHTGRDAEFPLQETPRRANSTAR